VAENDRHLKLFDEDSSISLVDAMHVILPAATGEEAVNLDETEIGCDCGMPLQLLLKGEHNDTK
jgi:hypothetical protein